MQWIERHNVKEEKDNEEINGAKQSIENDHTTAISSVFKTYLSCCCFFYLFSRIFIFVHKHDIELWSIVAFFAQPNETRNEYRVKEKTLKS